MSVARVDGVEGAGEAAFEVVDRRRLMLGGLAAVAGAGVVASVAEPAVAANGGPVILGASNTATATTQVATSTSGTYALKGVQTATTGSGAGVWGQASKGTGVYGSTNGATYSAVLGRNTSTTYPGGWGVRGVVGAVGTGVRGETADVTGAGVHGVHLGTGFAVRAQSTQGGGVYAECGTVGVQGISSATGGYGVLGGANGTNATGVYGYANGSNGVGVLGSGTAHAGYFAGNVEVTGTLSKAGGSFRIDHPLDPANKFLSHSFVESPDMKNIYDGVVVLDDDGSATVEMPEWFEALNRDFRYQLTALDGPAPNLHIASDIKDRKFAIAGGDNGQRVSWMVTGIRQDAWANANRIPVEEDKTKAERGKYLHPALVKGGKPIFKAPQPPKAPKPSKVPLDVPVR